MERNELIFKKMARYYQLAILMAIVVVGRVVYLQYINPTKVTTEDIAFRGFKLDAVRGDILAHDGRTLATSVPYYKVRMDCTVQNKDTFNKYIDGLSRSLAAFFKDKPAKEYKKLINSGRAKGKKYLSVGNRLVDYSELEKIKKFPLFEKGANRGGIIVEEKYKRTNPYGRKAYRTIGFINSEGVGVGIEGTWDYYLKGKPGVQIRQKILGGEWIPINTDQNVAPENGYDIRTTINIDFQEAVENALKEQLSKGQNIEGATAVVMETKTGAIRAISNLKNDGKGGFDESLNYAIGQATEPGSVLKLVTLVALLEDGYVTLDTQVDGGNGVWVYLTQKVTDSHAVGMQDVRGAFAQSSNVCFAKLATTYYAKDPKKFVNRVQNMKIGERFHLDIQGEAASTIHSPESSIWTPGLLASMGFGYGMLITPLHTLTFYNAIANDGKMMKPYFIEDYERDGEIIKQFKPQEISGAICSKETAKAAQEAMRAVVTNGTGKMMQNDWYAVSGKTGTARVAFPGGGYERNGMRKYQATFCGYFPSENPAYSMIVILYSGETAGSFYGATWAGPVFKKISDFIYANSPEWNGALTAGKGAGKRSNPSIAKGMGAESRKALEVLPMTNRKEVLAQIGENSWVSFRSDSGGVKARNFPVHGDSLVNVIDMGLKDALYLLENQGYRVKFTGRGRVVSQHPEAGAHIAKNSLVTLELAEN